MRAEKDMLGKIKITKMRYCERYMDSEKSVNGNHLK